MAKTRAQRKAERRAREAEDGKAPTVLSAAPSRGRSTTPRSPVSGDVAEIEAVEAGIAAGASEAQLETPDAPKPRSDRRAEAKAQKQADEARARRAQAARERAARQETKAGERPTVSAAASSASSFPAGHELKKVQWPDRDTLVQATAVTVIFVAVAAAYLGALDALFNWLVKQILVQPRRRLLN